MANENPIPDDEDDFDPFEAELVAYLDGEADETTVRKVEERLAKDPVARTRAAELKKSFDLLDYLPKSEPSPNFTTRTLDKLPPVRPADKSRERSAERTDSTTPRDPPPATARTNKHKAAAALVPGSDVSTSLPMPLEAESHPASVKRARPQKPSPRKRPRSLLWFGGFVAAVVAFTSLGYAASAFVRPYLLPREKDKEPDDTRVEAEPRVIERLPLYAVADDINFVNELAKPERFSDDPAVAFDPTLKIPQIPPGDVADKPTPQEFETLQKSFRALPTARQAEIVKLDQDLHAKEPKERDRLFRVLEAYAAWLGRLSDADRRFVMSATSADARLKAVDAIRERQWLDSLPPPLKAKLDSITSVSDKNDLISQWKAEDAIRRRRWAFLRQNVEAFAANNSPWPFDTERGRNDVIEFATAAFKSEDKRRCRLSGADLAEYNRTLAAAKGEDTWAWYGLVVYELTKLHPYLPEPDNAKLMTDFNDLPDIYQRRLDPKKGPPFGLRPRLNATGKWPEFPMEVLQVTAREPWGKGFNPPPLGPSRVSEFKPAVREFATQLFLKMTFDEKRDLERLQGKWPEYPQQFMYYAHKYDLSVPGASLPGSPKKWELIYGIRGGPREK